MGVKGIKWRDLLLLHFVAQFIKVLRLKRRMQHAELVDDASQRPDVGLVVVGVFSPHLRRGVVGSSCLRLGEVLLAYL